MGHRFGKKILKWLLLFGLIASPISLLGRSYKNWVILFLLNSYVNFFIAPILAKKKVLRYPVRFLPKYYKSSIIYDYCLCSLVTVWYCRLTNQDSFKQLVLKVWLFSIPQALMERWLERHTQLIKYSKGWNWIYSLLTITSAKLVLRCFLIFLDRTDKKMS
ncbi:hypothetical protein DS745_03100 [Anaerobacillus alkaliphilus]|uniref:Uncharacterized protein n=1 Tax=Anaerobacillus alkaliphilus TaxID=1548597 RepID=A0A4Q0VZ09_9BACI|nr:hypothetical protein DS745_03100 [Anaerobacillus alkaliphilus]